MKKEKKGFSLIELLVVIAVIIIIAGVLMFANFKIHAVMKEKRCSLALEQISAGMVRVKNITGYFPISQEAFELFLKSTEYFENVPVNPYWNDEDNPEKGWIYCPDTFEVFPKSP